MKLTQNKNIMLFRFYNEEEFFIEVVIKKSENEIGYYCGKSDIGIIDHIIGFMIEESIDYDNQEEVVSYIERQLIKWEELISEAIEDFDENHNF